MIFAKVDYPFKRSSFAISVLGVLGATVCYLIFKRFARGRMIWYAGGMESQPIGADASPLTRMWHSLDKERWRGHIPRGLARRPKDIDKRIHTEPFVEEASYLD